MKNIAIVGCGPAGLSAAIALHDAGQQVCLFEQSVSTTLCPHATYPCQAFPGGKLTPNAILPIGQPTPTSHKRYAIRTGHPITFQQ